MADDTQMDSGQDRPPTTAEVRDCVTGADWDTGYDPEPMSGDAFDRWLAAHEAVVRFTTLIEAAEAIDCRKAALTPGCDVDPLDYDTAVDCGTDLAAWWLRARAAELGQS